MQVVQTKQNVSLRNGQTSGTCSMVIRKEKCLIIIIRFDTLTNLCTTDANQHSSYM